MAFTYSAVLNTNLSIVRFLLQDTTNTATRPNLLDDGEITWALSTEANVYMAAAICAEVLASRPRGLNSKSVGALSLSWGPETWKAVAMQLRLRGSTHQVPTAGGITESDREAIWANNDLLRPSFYSRLHQDPEGLSPAHHEDVTDEEMP